MTNGKQDEYDQFITTALKQLKKDNSIDCPDLFKLPQVFVER